MMQSLRYIKICMVASIALFFSVISLDNIVDFESNWLFVQHVLTMDTTFHHSTIMWRAVNYPVIQRLSYFLIIAWEIITAIVCWLGCLALLLKINDSDAGFHKSKQISFIGLFLGFLLYMLGFVIIGGEWFASWQSSSWNGQNKAGLFITIIMLVTIFLATKEA